MSIIQEILATPALVIGIAALVGLLLQKKKTDDIVKGTVKTIAGFVILSAGSQVLQEGPLNDFGVLFSFAFNLQGVVPNMEAIASVAIADYAWPTSVIMCFGMIANIVIARFSNLKYIFLTGHHTLYMACLIAVALTVGGLDGLSLMISGALLLGLLMAFFPALSQKTVMKITGKNQIALGHFSTTGYILTAWVARACTKKRRANGNLKKTEDIHFPQQFTFIRDTTVAISIVMIILFMIITGVAHSKSGFDQLDIMFFSNGYRSWAVYAVMSGIWFAAGIYIILAGVRMVLAEIVPAFKGIADKLVPDAKPALDCPVLFSSSPNAVMIGFFVSFTGGLSGMFCLYLINHLAGKPIVPIIIPGVVAHFFCGATAGVFGNAEGGLKGCVIGSFIHGLCLTFLPIMVMPVIGTLNLSGTTFSDTDFCVIGLLLGKMANITNPQILFVLCISLYLMPIIWHQIHKRRIET